MQLESCPLARDNVRENPTAPWVRRGSITCQPNWCFELPVEELDANVYAIRDAAPEIGWDTRTGLIVAIPVAALAFLLVLSLPPSTARWQLLLCGVVLGIAAVGLGFRAARRRLCYRELIFDLNSQNVLLNERRLLGRHCAACALDEIEIGYCPLAVVQPHITVDSVLIVTPTFRMIFISQPIRVEGWKELLERLPDWMKARLVRGLRGLQVLPLP